jgi:hypothetical protein
MATAKSTQSKSLLEDLDALVDQSINAMTPAQLKKFRRDRKKIMEGVRRRAADSPALRESGEQEKQALRA